MTNTTAWEKRKKEAGPMRKAYALSLIDKFPPVPKGHPFPLDQDKVIAELRDRVAFPEHQHQRDASLCGPAAFFYCLLNYKPELYVQYVIDLFTTGKARLGSLKVEPSLSCRAYQPGDQIAAVDWIALASLRDSENTVMSYSSVGDQTSGITRPSTIANWLRAVGYQAVRDDTNYYFCKGRKEVDGFNRDVQISRDVCLLINANMLINGKTRLKSTFSDHWVVVADDSPNLKDGKIDLFVYSWGDIHNISDFGDLSLKDFLINFYGYVSAAPKFQ
jgi:hypothetical protein